MKLIHWDFGDGSVVTGTLTPTHIYPDDGSFPVTLTVTDTLGSVGQDSLLVTVNNLAPVVDAGSDANVLVGETFTQMGSFTDPGADTWTATVDYGTGGGPASLVLLNKTFTLSHTYPTAGVYTTTVTVEDDDGGMGTDEVVVTVSEEIADLEITQSVSNDFFDHIFTIVVSNNGPDDAAGAVVSVTFPSEFSSVTWTCQGTGGATCATSGSGNTINDTLSTFPNGGVATYCPHGGPWWCNLYQRSGSYPTERSSRSRSLQQQLGAIYILHHSLPSNDARYGRHTLTSRGLLTAVA